MKKSKPKKFADPTEEKKRHTMIVRLDEEIFTALERWRKYFGVKSMNKFVTRILIETLNKHEQSHGR